MPEYNLQDTIVAIATPIGDSGIGIVRLSGKEALSIADKIFTAKKGGSCFDFESYTTHYGWIVDKGRHHAEREDSERIKGEVIDEVILTVMRAPKSYTREDIIEINCHGGIVALQKVLSLALEKGCRLAEPGEFTKRAFLNGRIDLAQAEAVLDIIKARTDAAFRVGLEQLRGGISLKIKDIRKSLLEVSAHIEASIDFPEEGIGTLDTQQAVSKLKNVDRELRHILDTSRYGRVMREGISAVICGRPNVGKSSLLNALLRQERSLVTHLPGTTRDTIEEVINIKGIPVRIMDTAGIMRPQDLIAKKAVERSRRYIRTADLIILVLDGSSCLSVEDRKVMKNIDKKKTIAVINKIDLRQRIKKNALGKGFKTVIPVSAKKRINIDGLEEAIFGLVYHGQVNASEPVLVSNLRHIEALKKAEKLIAEAVNSLDNKTSLEFVAQDIKDALLCLDELLGKKFSEDLLDKIFGEFCIGK